MSDGNLCIGQRRDFVDAKRACKIRDERSGNRIAIARVRGGAVLAKRKRTRRVQQSRQIKIHFDFGFVGDLQRCGERDARGVRVAREVICPAVEFAVRVAPQTFEREKNKAALPAPVQSVQVWIQRMAGGKLGDIGVIQIGVQADEKAHRTKFARWDFIQPDGIAVCVKVQPRDGVRNFQPRAIVALQREVTDEITDARDGKRFARRILITKGGGLQIFAGNLGRDFNLQRSSGSWIKAVKNGEAKNNFPRQFHFES